MAVFNEMQYQKGKLYKNRDYNLKAKELN